MDTGGRAPGARAPSNLMIFIELANLNWHNIETVLDYCKAATIPNVNLNNQIVIEIIFNSIIIIITLIKRLFLIQYKTRIAEACDYFQNSMLDEIARWKK